MGSSYPNRFMELLEQRGEPATVIGGAIFTLYSGMVVPFGPADTDYTLSSDDASRALRALGGRLVRTTTGFADARAGSEWYAVICRAFTPIASVSSSNLRSKLRRALKNCDVMRITPQELAQSGYDVYRKAFVRYRGANPPMSPSAFEVLVLASEGFDDIVHHWAVVCDGRLAGFSSNYVFGETEASYSILKFDPDYLRKYASYALFHKMNEFYLAQRKVAYVNDGFRAIRHRTELQPFLEHNFSFEKAYTGVDVHYRSPYGLLVWATFPLRHLLARLDDRARAVYELERAVRAGRVT